MTNKVGRVLLPILFLLFFSNFVFAASPKKILKIQDLKPGTKAIGFSVFEGIEPEPFNVELGQLTQQEGLNLILARIFGGPMKTPLEKVGAIAGMSGSPIFVDCAENKTTSEEKLSDCITNGTLVGAVSYRPGDFIEEGINSMITPAEYMLGARSGGYGAVYGLNHAPPKVSFQGREYINLMIAPKIDKLSSSASPSSKCPDSSGRTLKPGSMVSVYLAWGQIPVFASGTVTWVDGNLIYAFGHPLFEVGIVNFPFSHVSVAATLQTPLRPHKIAGCYLDTSGLMVVDGAYEMAGTIGASASLVPYQVDIIINGQKISLSEEITPSPMARSIMSGLPPIWAKNILGDIDSLSAAYQIRIAIRNQQEVFLKSIIPAQIRSAENPFNGVLSRLDEIIFRDLAFWGLANQIEKIHVQVNFVTNLRVWRGKTSFLSQKTAVPGETVYVNVVLEELSSGDIKQVSIPVKIPDDFMNRLEPGDTNVVNVFVQSGSRFTDKQDKGFGRSTLQENVIREMNTDINRQVNVLYVQQVLPKTRSDKEGNRNLAKSGTKSAWKWNDLESGELNQLPSKNDVEVVVNTTSLLDNFIDFNATFSIRVESKKETVKSSVDQNNNKKNRKWFLLFLQ